MIPRIIDCTLRDGSYVNDFQFTAEQTRQVLTSLQKAGITHIELGHGIGLNASNHVHKATETDKTYLQIAHETLNKAKFGMFYIPSIGRLQDLDLASKYEMDFVRIGTNVTEVEQAKEHIEYAKDLSFMVSSNLMKSYVLPPHKFIEQAKKAEDYGVDVVTLVDSAGGMLPEQVKEYIELMKENLSVDIGFHGHNNLSLAIANTLTAIKYGAKFVDTSLAGLGRSGGNASTEHLLLILNEVENFDIFELLDISDIFAAPLVPQQNSIDTISGFAQFHSSFLTIFQKASNKYNVDVRKLIIEVCKVEKIRPNEDLVIKIAREL